MNKKNISINVILNKNKLLYLRLFSILTLLAVSSIVLQTLSEPLLDLHSFRQTQTALTSLYFIKDGFKFAYETPVAGAPWSIPFEFPLFQYIVALTTKFSGLPLVDVGRGISFLFFAGIIPLVFSINKTLGLDRSSSYIFSILIVTTPIYIYWSRAFMIETCALFFTVASIKLFIDIELSGPTLVKYALFFMALCAALLQKSTTALPFVSLCILFLIHKIYPSFIRLQLRSLKPMFPKMLIVFGALLITIGWVAYTDSVKIQNQFGAELTSGALSKWNWGTINQRFDISFYYAVFWKRIFDANLAHGIGLFFIFITLFKTVESKVRTALITSVLLGVAPVLLFANLHAVHDYYQMSSTIFFVYALSVALVDRFHNILYISFATLIITIINFISFKSLYYPHMIKTFENDKIIRVTKYLNTKTNEDDQFVAFGNDWSSSYSYYAERKSFTVPVWFSGYEAVKEKPENYVDPNKLKVVFSCDNLAYNFFDLKQWADKRGWSVEDYSDCRFAFKKSN